MAKYPGRVYAVNLLKEALATDTWYILVDRSNTNLYSHPSGTQTLKLLRVDVSTEKDTSGLYDLWLGVVYENDATDGSIGLIHCWHIQADGNPTDSTDRFVDHLDFTCGGANPEGLDLSTVAEDLGSTLLTDGAFANWTSDELDSWSETNCDAAEDASGQTGSAAKVTDSGSGTGYIYQAVTVTAGKLYKVQFYYKNTAGDTAQYAFYDVTGSADILATTDLANSTSFSAIQTAYFVAPESCASMQVRFGAKGNGDIVWFDTAAVYPVDTIEGPVYLRGYRMVDQTGLQTDANDLNTAMGMNWTSGGDQASAGVGDIVLYAEETSGSGNLDISLTLLYTAH